MQSPPIGDLHFFNLILTYPVGGQLQTPFCTGIFLYFRYLVLRETLFFLKRQAFFRGKISLDIFDIVQVIFLFFHVIFF